ncbi:hypothetical protein SAMN04488054_12730 [Salibacterium qingdaonense]|uniref:Uncharacterized protein n=1 Tax=Salibacterium qingdaonense TaxID=266892 RepID=A0A1I4PJZ3_9BACI|nr:hypothetical protein SAMN04488054_12730 [Salibacterium qingdaonense]
MQKNAGLLLFSINLLIVFGGGFVISYVRTGDFYIGQMIGTDDAEPANYSCHRFRDGSRRFVYK